MVGISYFNLKEFSMLDIVDHRPDGSIIVQDDKGTIYNLDNELELIEFAEEKKEDVRELN